jgi:hypothetical protein
MEGIGDLNDAVVGSLGVGLIDNVKVAFVEDAAVA